MGSVRRCMADGDGERAAPGYSCSHLSSTGPARAMVGATPMGARLEVRYLVMGIPEESCSEVCPYHGPRGREVAIALDAGLIEQLYYAVQAIKARGDFISRERHKSRPLNSSSQLENRR